jgi:hypothetical protein
VTLHAGEIAAVIVLWAAGLTAILLTTAAEETRTLWWASIRPGRQPRLGGSVADLVPGVPAADDDVVDSREIRDTFRSASPRPAHPVEMRAAVETGPPGESAQPAIDPLAQQAATLLAKAMVTSHDRERLWQQFHELVVATAAELEEAPVREAIEEIERQGLSLDVVARVVRKRLSE